MTAFLGWAMSSSMSMLGLLPLAISCGIMMVAEHRSSEIADSQHTKNEWGAAPRQDRRG